MQVRKFRIGESTSWQQVGEGQIFVADLIDAATDPEAKMTVGFARLAKGEALDHAFPYDEVLILTAYAFQNGEVLALDLETGEIRNSSNSTAYEEAEGVDPTGELSQFCP